MPATPRGRPLTQPALLRVRLLTVRANGEAGYDMAGAGQRCWLAEPWEPRKEPKLCTVDVDVSICAAPSIISASGPKF